MSTGAASNQACKSHAVKIGPSWCQVVRIMEGNQTEEAAQCCGGDLEDSGHRIVQEQNQNTDGWMNIQAEFFGISHPVIKQYIYQKHVHY